MAKLRIRIVLNEGGEGVPLHQMASVAKETEKFLRWVARDAGIAVAKGQILARNFKDGSLCYDEELPKEYAQAEVAKFNAAINFATAFDPDSDRLDGLVRQDTLMQFARIAESLAVHEKIGFGLYTSDSEEPDVWHPLTKRRATSLQERLSEEIEYVGSVRGQIHNVVVESPQWFGLRLSNSERIVHCDVRRSDVYAQVRDAISIPGRIVFVRGRINARRIDRQILSVTADRIKITSTLSDAEYAGFFGSAPGYTGELTTEQFIDEARDYGD